MKVDDVGSDCVGCDGLGRVPRDAPQWWRFFNWMWLTVPCGRCSGAGVEPKRLFVLAGVDGGTLRCYGELPLPQRKEAAAFIREAVLAELMRSFVCKRGYRINVRCELRSLTAAEVAALPDG